MRISLTFVGTLFVALALTVAPAAGQSAGGGAEIPAVAFKQWCVMVTTCTYEVHDADLDLDELRKGKVDWIGVDEPLNAAQRRQAGGPVTYVPMMLGALGDAAGGKGGLLARAPRRATHAGGPLSNSCRRGGLGASC